MKYSTRLSDAAHILIFIHLNPHSDLSSSAISESIHTHPSYIRQLMCDLKKAGIIDAKRGQAKPVLCRDLDQISLLDIYRAVEGDKLLLHQDENTNPECSLGLCIQESLCTCFQKVQASAEETMQNITLKEVLQLFYDSHPECCCITESNE